MKKILLLGTCTLLCAGGVSGQAGQIGLYFDHPGYSCDCYYDIVVNHITVYVVHTLTPGAAASQFMVTFGGGFSCTYTGEDVAFPTVIGSVVGGLSVSYGGCLSSNILIATMNFFCMGTSPVGAYLQVVADPGAPTGNVEVVDCNFVKLVGYGGRGYINPEYPRCCCISPVKQTSWGDVKALYR